jgi:hypothetical protein
MHAMLPERNTVVKAFIFKPLPTGVAYQLEFLKFCYASVLSY